MGSVAIDRTISGVTSPFTEQPRNTSAPFIASARVRALVSRANSAFHSFMPSVRPLKTTPFVSTSVTFARFTPSAR